MTQYQLGRRHAPDSNDAKFPMMAVLPPRNTVLLPTYKYNWAYGFYANQTGDTCVANAWTHFLTDSPRTHKIVDLDNHRPAWVGNWMLTYTSLQSSQRGFRGFLYDKAQTIDEFDDTPPQGGTSVRAGAKALQAMGAIKSYHWAQSVDDIAYAVLTGNPVVVGTTWYNSMFNPDSKGRLVVDVASGVAGGHAWKIDGYNSTTKLFRMKNSWSINWGNKGFANINYSDIAMLLADNGEAAIALEY